MAVKCQHQYPSQADDSMEQKSLPWETSIRDVALVCDEYGIVDTHAGAGLRTESAGGSDHRRIVDAASAIASAACPSGTVVDAVGESRC